MSRAQAARGRQAAAERLPGDAPVEEPPGPKAPPERDPDPGEPPVEEPGRVPPPAGDPRPTQPPIRTLRKAIAGVRP